MIRKEVAVYLETLAGYINDDDKLITYKWLSKELNIHVNLAKQILYEYWENNREKKNLITSTFLLMGYLEDGAMRVEVVKEKDLTSVKNNYTKIISEHIYSLQKSLPDLELLAISDKGNTEHSAVRCNEAVIRSDYEMEVLRWGSNLNAKNKQSVVPIKEVRKQINTNNAKPVEQSNGTKKESVNKSANSKSAETKTKTSALHNLFAKAIDKQNKEKNTASGSSTDNKVKTTVTKTVSNELTTKSTLFEDSKKAKVVKEQPENNKNSSNPTKKQKISIIVDSDDSDDATSRSPTKNWFESKKKVQEETNDKFINDDKNNDVKGKKKSPENVTAAKKKPAASSRGKKRKSSSKTESTSKKRKRIVVEESSEDSCNSEIEDIMEPESPEERQVSNKLNSPPSPPLIKCDGGRRKVRKLVDKTFMDEDGYFVTQKEYVYESCSDKEEEREEKSVAETAKPSTSETTTKNTNKRKQATLLNFFKKA